MCKKSNKELQGIPKAIKDNIENSECTFVPKISCKNKLSTSESHKDSVFFRLNKARNGKHRIDNYIQTFKSEDEMKKCTFHPKVNSDSNNANSLSSDSIFHKLYFDYKLK